MILENVTVDVYDFSFHDGMHFTSDDAAKSLACMDVDTQSKFDVILGRLPAENDFPECGVRLSQSELIYVHNEEQRTFRAENEETQEEGGILKYDHLPMFPTSSTQPLPLLARSLPKDRISPFRVAFVINLLKRNQKLGNPLHETIPDPQLVQECADHLQSYLEITPGRSVAFGAVTNLHQCFFVAVCVDEGGPYHRRAYLPFNSSLVIGSKNVARELARFCATDPLAMGLNPALFHSPHLKVESLLGRGRKSVVMEGHWQGNRIVLKVSMNKKALELKSIMLGYLEVKGLTHVPRIHKEVQVDLFPRYNESCTAFRTLTGLTSCPKETITKEQMLQVWGILKRLHAVGIVHRDVRAANMMCDKSGNMCLRGFTAAQFYSTALAGEHLEEALGRPLADVVPLYNRRNANTASAAVLIDNLPTLPADEACAIIYAAIQVSFPDSLLMHVPLPRDIEDHEFCAGNRDTWPDQWSKKLTPAMSHDITIFQKSLAELEKHRADPTFTPSEMDIAVQEAVKAVYRFGAAHQAAKGDDESHCELPIPKKARTMHNSHRLHHYCYYNEHDY
eukprot:gene9380-11043_t